MKKTLLCLILFCYAILGDLQAQNNISTNEFSKEVQLLIGKNFGYFKDLNFSPLNYQLNGAIYSVSYFSPTKNGNGAWKFHLDYGQGEMTTNASERFTSQYQLGTFQMDRWKKWDVSSAGLTIYGGLGYRFDFNYFDYNNQDALSFLIGHNLAASGMLAYQLNEKHSFRSQLSTNLISFVGRPPYAGLDEKLEEKANDIPKLLTDGKVVGFNKYPAINFSLNYAYHLSEKWDLNVAYQLKYQCFNDVHLFTQVQNQLNLGLTIKF